MSTAHPTDDRNDYVSATTPARNDQGMGDTFSRLSELIKTLSNDVGNLMTLQIGLLKAETREGAKTLARDSALLIAGSILAYIAFCVITLALIGFIAAALPMDLLMAVAVSALIVGVLYALIAGGLAWAGINHLKKRGVAPERSIEEIRRDKEWVKDIRT